MAQSRQACVNKQQDPARRNIRIVGFALSESPDEVYECHDHDGDQRYSQERMGESPMMSKAKSGTFDSSKNIQVGSLGGKRQRECSKRRLAIKSCAPQARASQKVSDRFQSKGSILHGTAAHLETVPLGLSRGGEAGHFRGDHLERAHV
jgi:hypothetical protein